MANEHPVIVWLLIEENGSVLVTKRKADGGPFAGGWTLPGDELDRGKSPSDLIAEFAHDQLDIQVMGDEPFQTLHISDGRNEYAIAVHRIGYEGRPRFRDSGPYTEVGWAPRSELVDVKAFPYLAELAGYLAGEE